MDARVRKMSFIEIVKWIFILLSLAVLMLKVDGQPFPRSNFRSFGGQAQRSIFSNGGQGHVRGQIRARGRGQGQRRPVTLGQTRLSPQLRRTGSSLRFGQDPSRLVPGQSRIHRLRGGSNPSVSVQRGSGTVSSRAARKILTRQRAQPVQGRSSSSNIHVGLRRPSQVVPSKRMLPSGDASRSQLRMDEFQEPKPIMSGVSRVRNVMPKSQASTLIPPLSAGTHVQDRLNKNEIHEVNVDNIHGSVRNLELPPIDNILGADVFHDLTSGTKPAVVDLSKGILPSENHKAVDLNRPVIGKDVHNERMNVGVVQGPNLNGHTVRIGSTNNNNNNFVGRQTIQTQRIPRLQPKRKIHDVLRRIQTDKSQRQRIILIRGKDGKLRRYNVATTEPSTVVASPTTPPTVQVIPQRHDVISGLGTNGLNQPVSSINSVPIKEQVQPSLGERVDITLQAGTVDTAMNINNDVNTLSNNNDPLRAVIAPTLPQFDIMHGNDKTADISIPQQAVAVANNIDVGLDQISTHHQQPSDNMVNLATSLFGLNALSPQQPVSITNDNSIGVVQTAPIQSQQPVSITNGNSIGVVQTAPVQSQQPNTMLNLVDSLMGPNIQSEQPVLTAGTNQPIIGQSPAIQPQTSNSMLDLVNSLFGSNVPAQAAVSLTHNVPPPSIAHAGLNPVQQIGISNHGNNLNWQLAMAQQQQNQQRFGVMPGMFPWYAQNNFMSLGGMPTDPAQLQELMYGDTTDPPDIPDPTPKPGSNTAAPEVEALPSPTKAPAPFPVKKKKRKHNPRHKAKKPIVKRKKKPLRKVKTTRPAATTVTTPPSAPVATTTSSVYDLAEQIIAALFGPSTEAPMNHVPAEDVKVKVPVSDVINNAANKGIVADTLPVDMHRTEEIPIIANQSPSVANVVIQSVSNVPEQGQMQPVPSNEVALPSFPNDILATKSIEASFLDLFGSSLNSRDVTHLSSETQNQPPKSSQPVIAPFLSSNDFGGLSIQKITSKPKPVKPAGVPVPVVAINDIVTALARTTEAPVTTMSSISLIESALNSVANGSNAGLFDLLNNINLLWDINPTAPQTTTTTSTTMSTTTTTPSTTTTPKPTTTTTSTLPPTTTTTPSPVLDIPINLIEAFLNSQRKAQQPPIERCTPQSPNFVCKGKAMFTTVADIGNWCKDMCLTGSCMDAICTCSCPKQRRWPQPMPNKNNWQRRRQNRNKVRNTNKKLWSRTTTEEPPEEEEIEAEDMPSTTVSYDQTTSSDWWGSATSTQTPFGAAGFGESNINQVGNSNAHVTELPILAWASQLKAQLEAMTGGKAQDSSVADASGISAMASLFESAPTTPKSPPDWRGTRWALPPPPSKKPPSEGEEGQSKPKRSGPKRRGWPRRRPRRPTTPPAEWGSGRDGGGWGTTPETPWGRRSGGRWNNPAPTPTPWQASPDQWGNHPEWGGGSRDTWREPVPRGGSDRRGSWGDPTPTADHWGSRWEPRPRRGNSRLRNKWRRAEQSAGGEEPPDK